MIYSGQLDVIVGASLTESFLNALQWSGAQGFASATKNIWKVQGGDVEVAGWARQYQNLTHVIVRGAGYVVRYNAALSSCGSLCAMIDWLIDSHILPWDQPVRGYDMLTRFIQNKPFTN